MSPNTLIKSDLFLLGDLQSTVLPQFQAIPSREGVVMAPPSGKFEALNQLFVKSTNHLYFRIFSTKFIKTLSIAAIAPKP